MIIYIPGELMALLTFPGVVIHEISHRLMCDIFKVSVYEVKYFNIGSKRAGHVLHGRVKSLTHSLLISLAPLIINSLVCFIFVFPLSASMYVTREFNANIFNLVLFWIGVSSGFNAMPSDQDINSILSVPLTEETFNRTVRALRALTYILPFYVLLIGLSVYLFLYLIFN